jgi:EAL domain-containing protein (putative c-di-GMP-specific phosphodiesterase class I)
MARWRREARGAGQAFVSILVSAAQLRDLTLLEDITQTLGDVGLSPDALVLAIAPSQLTSASPRAENTSTVVLGLCELGVDLAIEDFGMGESSLSLIKTCPPRMLSIAKVFVDDLGAGPDDESIVATQISLSHTLGIATLANGVETPSQLLRLAMLGCDFYRGDLLSPPVSAAAVDFTVRAPSNAPGWYPDPHRLYDWRHWDGKMWTGHVAADGQTHWDPVGRVEPVGDQGLTCEQVLANLEILTAEDIRVMWAHRNDPSAAVAWRSRFGLSKAEGRRQDTDPADRLRLAYLGGLIVFQVAPPGATVIDDGYIYLGLNVTWPGEWSADWGSEWYESRCLRGDDVTLSDLLRLWELRGPGPDALGNFHPYPCASSVHDVRVRLDEVLGDRRL